MLVPLLGLVTGIVSLLRSRHDEDQRSSASVAILIALPIFGFMLWSVVTGFRQHQYQHRRGQELTVMETLRWIHNSQEKFFESKRRFGTLKELADSGLLDELYATGKTISGYTYSETDISSDTYCAHADRERDDRGSKDFSISETGDIRYIESETKGTVPRNGGRSVMNRSE